MSGIGKRAEPGSGQERTEAWIGDRRLRCLVCGEGAFAYREVLLNTSGMTYLGLDWLNRSATGVVCLACGFVHEFLGDKVQWREPQHPDAPWMDADGQ